MAETITSAYALPFQLSTSCAAYVTDQDSAATTIAAGSNGVDLATSPADIFVASSAALAAFGVVKITGSLGDTYVTYTSKSAGKISGCSGGTGVVHTGDAVVQVRQVAFNPSGTVWYRTFLCPTTGAGTSSTDPKELLAHLQSIIRGANSRWFVTMQSNGRVRIRYNGTGLGTIKWVSLVIPTLIGFTSAQLTLFIASLGNDYSDGTYSPTHMMFIQGRSGDTGWQDEPAGEAGTEFPDGTVDYLGDQYTKSRRAYTLARLPRADGIVTSAVTPMFPIDTATTRRKQPALSITPGATPIQWSVLEFIACAMGQRIAVSHGLFQSYATSSPAYDLCYFSPKTREGKAIHSAAYWSERMDRPGVEVLFYGTGVVT